MPVLSFFPVPETRELGEWEVTLTGVAGERRSIGGKELQALPRVREKSPFECQIFNWAEEPEVEGLRLVDLLDATGVDAPDGEYFSFYSADGLYFEGLPRTMARDPRTLLVFGLDHNPLPSLGAVRTGLQECEVAPHDSSFSARPRRDQKAARPEPVRRCWEPTAGARPAWSEPDSATGKPVSKFSCCPGPPALVRQKDAPCREAQPRVWRQCRLTRRAATR